MVRSPMNWQLSQKAYVLDNVANNYYMTAVNPNERTTANYVDVG